jgi:thioredoxin-like negative regulator of GroEL
MRKHGALALGCALLAAGLLQAGTAAAQTVRTPNASQKASVSQTVGLTDITIVYHRPLVNGRTIWGGLEPYDRVWRAGANENTTISFSTDVTVEGQPLPAGTYGLHMIPTKGDWTVIFSKDSQAWGSYFYDQAQDALRVTVKPAAEEHHEALTYELVDPKPDSVVAALKWEKVAVPFKIGVDLKKTVLASIQQDLRSLPAFTWEGNATAAQWAAENDVNLEEALRWVDRSIEIEERFENLRTKSQLLAKLGKEAEAAQLMARAVDRGNAGQLHNYGRQLLNQGKKQEALAIFKKNAEKNPDAWFVGAGLARAQAAVGDFENAVVNMKKSVDKAPEPQKTQLQALLQRLEKREDIN